MFELLLLRHESRFIYIEQKKTFHINLASFRIPTYKFEAVLRQDWPNKTQISLLLFNYYIAIEVEIF